MSRPPLPQPRCPRKSRRQWGEGAEETGGRLFRCTRIARLDADIAECVEGWALAPLVKNLQAFRGIKLLTAVGIAAEIGDFVRFPKAGHFMGYVGLVPGENSSGQSQRQGGITKTGNRHVRRLLIEAAWHYFNASLVASAALTERRVGVSEEVIAITDQALRKKCLAMQLRKKTGTKIVTALARELAGFVWAVGHSAGVAVSSAVSKAATKEGVKEIPRPPVKANAQAKTAQPKRSTSSTVKSTVKTPTAAAQTKMKPSTPTQPRPSAAALKRDFKGALKGATSMARTLASCETARTP